MKAVSYIGYFKSVQEVQLCSWPRSQLSLNHSPFQHLSPSKKKKKSQTLKYKHISGSHLLYNLRLKLPSVTCTQLSKHKTDTPKTDAEKGTEVCTSWQLCGWRIFLLMKHKLHSHFEIAASQTDPKPGRTKDVEFS